MKKTTNAQRGDNHWTRKRKAAGLPASNLHGARLRKPRIPKPDKIDSRICFAINYFKSEVDAETFAADVVRRGITYNGGWYDGMPCGRDETWDYIDDDLGPLFAVTD